MPPAEVGFASRLRRREEAAGCSAEAAGADDLAPVIDPKGHHQLPHRPGLDGVVEVGQPAVGRTGQRQTLRVSTSVSTSAAPIPTAAKSTQDGGPENAGSRAA